MTCANCAATLMLAEDVPLAVMSAALGLSGVAITMAHYAAVVPHPLSDAAAAMDRALGVESSATGWTTTRRWSSNGAERVGSWRTQRTASGGNTYVAPRR
jgi:hypothetical protein